MQLRQSLENACCILQKCAEINKSKEECTNVELFSKVSVWLWKAACTYELIDASLIEQITQKTPRELTFEISQILRGGPLSLVTRLENLVNRKPPPGRGVLWINLIQKTPRELTFEEFLQKCQWAQCGCGRRCVNMGWASIKKLKSARFAAPQASCRTGSLLIFSR